METLFTQNIYSVCRVTYKHANENSHDRRARFRTDRLGPSFPTTRAKPPGIASSYWPPYLFENLIIHFDFLLPVKMSI
jgi:hypothetical protein